MIHITLLCVGKLKERFYMDGAAEYLKRLRPYCKCEVVELPEERLPGNPSPAQLQAALAKEGESIRARLSPWAAVAALCVEGETRSSEGLSKLLFQWVDGGTGHITFVIGGSHGLDSSVKELARLRLSMSPMTFPHHLARVMLLEQIYRAFQIREGTRYHK